MNSYDDQDRQPQPHNLEAEQAMLGALLVNNEVHPGISDICGPQHCYDGMHARVLEAIGDLIGRGKVASPISLAHIFANDETMNDLGGAGYLARLAASAPSIISAPDYATIVRDTADRRAGAAIGQDIIEAACDVRTNEDFHGCLAEKISDVSAILEGKTTKRKTLYTADEAGTAVIDTLAAIWQQDGTDPNAIKTGIASLDEMLGGGMRRGEDIVLAGRPGMGKTAAAVQIAMNVSEAGGGVGYFSLEMPVVSLTQRAVSSRLWTPDHPIDYARIGGCKIDEPEFSRIVEATEQIQGWPLMIDDRPGLTPMEVETTARIMAAKFERLDKRLDLIVVDHLHKMNFPGASNTVAKFSEISGRLAEIGKRLDCPVLALAQLNRGVESRDDKRPNLADLRESGSIEQDADAVLFCYRPAYYKERDLARCPDPGSQYDMMADLEAIKNDMEIIIGKQRNGPTGSTKLWCDMPSNVIRNDDRQLPDWSNAA